MEQNNYKLDDFLREQVDEAELPFQEVYWEKMEAMLDREDGKAGIPWWKRGLPLLLTVFILGTGALLYSKLKKATPQLATETVQTQAQGSNLPSGSAEGDSILQKASASTVTELATTTDQTTGPEDAPATNTALDAKDVQSGPATPPNKKDLVVSGNNQKAASPETVSQPTNSTALKTDASQPKTTVVSPLPKRSAPSAHSAESGSPSRGSDAAQAQGDGSNVGVARINKTQKPMGKKGKNKLAQQDAGLNASKAVSTSRDAQQPKVTDAAKGSNDNSGRAGVRQQGADPSVIVQGRTVIPRDSQTISVRKQQDPKQTNPRFIASLENYVPEYVDSIKIIHYDPVKKNVIEPAKIAENKVKPVRAPFESKPFELFVMAGANANFGMKGNQNRSTAMAVSPFVSLGVSKQISPKLTMAGQVGFTYFNGLNSNQQVSSKVYSFGVDSTLFSVEYKKLLQMYLPVSLYYEWMKNHSVMLSVGGAYALDVSSTVNDKGNSSSVLGYRSGFNPLDFFFQLGYQVRFNERLSLGIWYQQGLIDATRNSYFMNSQTDRQSRLSIGIKYSFTRSGR